MDAKVKNKKVTELIVPIDCNGCAKRFERKLHEIEGVEEVAIDITQQKIRVFGDADQEKILKAARKVRKTAKLCSPVKNESSNEDPKTTGEEGDEHIHVKLSSPVKGKSLIEDLQTTGEDEEDKYLNDWNMNNHDNYSYANHYSYSNYYNGYDVLPLEKNHEESKDKVVQEAETYYGEIDENQLIELFSDENPNACIIM